MQDGEPMNVGLAFQEHSAALAYLSRTTTVMSAQCIITMENVRCSERYVKTTNRSHNICNRPLTPVTCTHIYSGCYLAPVAYKRGRSTLGLAFAPLQMWTSGNDLLKRPLHEFFVTDVK
jgi:hypothetical protein